MYNSISLTNRAERNLYTLKKRNKTFEMSKYYIWDISEMYVEFHWRIQEGATVKLSKIGQFLIKSAHFSWIFLTGPSKRLMAPYQ